MPETLKEFELTEEDVKSIEAEAAKEVESQKKDEPVEVKTEQKPEEIKEEKKEEKSPEVVAKELYDNLHKALTQQRHENRNIKQTIEGFKKEFLNLKESLPKPERAPEPVFEEDPQLFLKHKIEQVDQKITKTQQDEEIKSQREELKNFTSQIEKLEIDFRKTKPDYDDAFKFLKDFRRQDLELYGITDEEALQKDLAQSSFNISLLALRAGKNPAEIIYQMASRYGYKPKSGDNSKKTDAQRHLEEVQKGQDATKTLAKGGESETAVTVEQLASAEGEEFDKLWDAYFKGKK